MPSDFLYSSTHLRTIEFYQFSDTFETELKQNGWMASSIFLYNKSKTRRPCFYRLKNYLAIFAKYLLYVQVVQCNDISLSYHDTISLTNCLPSTSRTLVWAAQTMNRKTYHDIWRYDWFCATAWFVSSCFHSCVHFTNSNVLSRTATNSVTDPVGVGTRCARSVKFTVQFGITTSIA